ncbi:MAG: excinuclease ABC subunit UvrA [Candidatus Nealsonbacteria bacterium CG_4_10_14_0_2_um_filter_40_15]|uniref:UvrABC system protein A n=2 Tax=Candidatus Nealsoniibacteriota TaxID=1817911 RepID=A0A2M7D8B7_9BACT|nr:MAG: excinuclease ABC subunit UvrA [Candidatus Nealsonbacteria bacterium CG02_land_8_20_14_3_00_40_11]PIZ87680.1 MAG: excinuclease ABC subunit UvrA [Candidatus Nealsonbacteria bacterium CG_4_10_14_0_2_um_filter_40_15]
MKEEYIKIRGARVHNLKNIDVDIPKNKLVVITGLSGSGKSSLAFDTLYAEGQRRYVESLSAYARQFLGVMDKPDVDTIEGISPAISIDQRKAARNPRSTVGTITEIYDYLRLLFARVGKPHCPKCGKPVSRQTIDQITDQILELQKGEEIAILGPVIRGKKGEHQGTLEEIQRGGFVRVRIDGIIYIIEEALEKTLDRKKKHNIEVVVDRLILEKGLDKSRLVDSLETALKLGKGVVVIEQKIKNRRQKTEDLLFSEHFACEECGVSLPEIEPRLFSFNSPFGACPGCQGLGKKLEVDPKLVIPNPNLTIAEGAIFPWAHASHKIGRQGYFWWQLQELAKIQNFSLDTPIKDLPKNIVDSILYGSGSFEGVIPNLERRYHETDSEYTRSELEQYMIEKKCEVCKGKRLKQEALSVTLEGKSGIDEIVEMSIDKVKEFFEKLQKPKTRNLKSDELKVSQPIAKEILNRLQFLIDVGLDYLTLERSADTLSGGEEERIRLATQIGSKLSGVLYILDEPSIGLHARDQGRLIETLKKLKDLGNTVIVVEHSKYAIKAADWIIDVGPRAGKHGGKIIFQGTPPQLLRSHTLTGDYLSGRKKVEIEKKTKIRSQNQNYLIIKKASEHNLKNINVKIPLGKFVCITGVSGSGKSSLMNDILAKALLKRFYRAKEEPGAYQSILGIEFLNKAVLVDQSPIGRTPRSNPATYTGAFSYIRDLFTKTKEARIRGYQPGRFSFNVKGGRCEACEGQGVKKIEMYFLPDVYVECEECKGKRFNRETLAIEYKGKNIAQALEMTVEEAMEFFKNIPGLYEKLKTLNEVGLGYVQLGQPAPSLSGGEAQRVKLATELSKKATGKTLYILDEPTTGLHPDDIKKLIFVLRELVNRGNTVICIEHELDVIKNTDYVIDLGPEGGEEGGYIIAEGSPYEIAKNRKSYTGKYLKEALFFNKIF